MSNSADTKLLARGDLYVEGRDDEHVIRHILLRRLLVKNCVFGVDRSAMGAEVATLSLWLASFVPGLSLSYLGRNVVVGDSLIGVADSGTVVQGGGFFAEVLRKRLNKATKIVRSMGDIDDRTPDEVEESRRRDYEARSVTAGLKQLFDLWTAEQFGLEDAREHAELHGRRRDRGDRARHETAGQARRPAR